MGGIIRFLSGLYLILIWAMVGFALFYSTPEAEAGARQLIYPAAGYMTKAGIQAIVILTGVLSSIPAILIYAFGQITDDVRAMRRHVLSGRFPA